MILCHADQGVLLDDRLDLGRREHGDARGDAQLRFQRLLDARPGFALRGTAYREDDVAAVEQRSAIGVTESFDEGAKGGHRDALRSAHIDSPQQRHVPTRCHDRFLSSRFNVMVPVCMPQAQNLLSRFDVNIERSADGICPCLIMIMARGSWIVAIAAALASCAPAGPPAAVVAQHVHQRLASTDDSAPVSGEALLEPRAVSRFYQSRQSRPAWDVGDAKAILESIRGVERDGLEPRDYHLEAIEALMERRNHEASADGVADLDVLLTDAVAGMADHMRYGKVRPSSVNPEWNVDPRDDAPPLEETVTRIA